MKTVLLADDEPEILDLLTYLFKQFKYKVITYPELMPIETIREVHPDVVILDHNFKKKSGGEFCIEIKKDPGTAHIPVVLFSSNENLPQIAKTSHADAYIEKPVDFETLLSTIRRVTMPEA